MQPNPPLDPSWSKYNKTFLLLEEIGMLQKELEMAVPEGTLETKFLKAGRESGEVQQEPVYVLVPMKFCFPGAGYPKTFWMIML